MRKEIIFAVVLTLWTSSTPAKYLQWFVKRQAQEKPKLIKQSIRFDPERMRLPESCPIPLEKIAVILKLDQQNLWVGGKEDFGVALYQADLKRWRYFGPARYMPTGGISQIGLSADGAIWVRSRGGISKLYTRAMTLEEKAKIFLERLRKRHVKHGFIRFLALKKPGQPELGGFLPHQDNDGLWTSLYVMTESFRYAVTRDPLAKKYARESLKALMWLHDITPVPGFIARSIVERGEVERRHYGGEWHLSKDGRWQWKGDTSSDESDGHFAAYAIYYDLVADEKEKLEIARYLRSMMDHIIRNNWYLVDVDGKPTTWGVWNPEVFKKTFWGKTARGLNALQVLMFLNVTYHATGEERYRKAFYDLIQEGYDRYLLRVSVTTHPRFVNHSDSELAAVAYYPFFRLEKDAQVLQKAQKGFQRWCKAELPERSPWFNFLCCIYGQDKKLCDRKSAIETLQDIPMSTLNWHVKNSHRADVKRDVPDRHNKLQLTRVLPISERCFLRWNGNPYRADECGNGNEEGDGVHFLLPYWLGRYHNLVSEE